MKPSPIFLILTFLAAITMALSSAAAQEVDVDEVAPAPPPQPAPAAERETPESRLWREIGNLLDELQRLRTELAQARLEADEARRELQDLRQFIEDHEVYGQDFEQYRGVREVAEREERRRATEAARERREAALREQQDRMQAYRAQRQAEREEARRVRQYRESGFNPLGLDVFISRVSYHYPTRDYTARLRFDPLIGWYQRFFRDEEVDFSQMTISGAVINASHETRNVGVAIAFFDGRGVQVGQETIHISNARPDVPYPFTSTVTMALDRPFTSSTSYVLYADPIDMGNDLDGELYEME